MPELLIKNLPKKTELLKTIEYVLLEWVGKKQSMLQN